jgi:site-specific DNA recombinase
MAVACYARVSTTRQAEQDLSIPDQLRQMRDYCKNLGLLIAQEYVEPGASATDDKRPVFQQMIADASINPTPFDAIIVHSLSRFFRDVISFGLYERKLQKLGIKVVSVSQQTTDDPSGHLARRVFSAFDEYQSHETSKHTIRAMRENARRGFFNGSRAPFGYRVIETEALGNRGRRRRKLAINESEAEVVRSVFDWYLNGHEGRSMGFKEIAKHLNARQLRMRGGLWGIQKIYKILSSETYQGQLLYNVIDSKSGEKRPPADWIAIPVDPIVDRETFHRARQRREGRRPSAMPSRLVSSPILLTGLLKCGYCHAGMTLATGKSGKYRYYKCTTRANKGNAQCPGRNVPMEKLDELVLEQLANRVFAPQRLQLILTEARKGIRARTAVDRKKIAILQGELRKADERLSRIYEAVETGILPLDETLQRRVQLAKASRENVLIEIAGLRRLQALPVERILPSQVEAFGSLIGRRLRDRTSTFGRDYLRAVVDKVVVNGDTATISGSNARLMRVVGTKPLAGQVPTFMHDWRARRDSNSRPPGS